MKQTLILIRGIPGAGKSTLAKGFQKIYPNMCHFEADQYFVTPSGSYAYDKNKIKEAHDWCKNNTKQAIQSGQSVVVSNTFIKLWELEFYLKLATQQEINYIVIKAEGNYKNIHDVPEHIIKRMQDNFQELPDTN